MYFDTFFGFCVCEREREGFGVYAREGPCVCFTLCGCDLDRFIYKGAYFGEEFSLDCGHGLLPLCFSVLAYVVAYFGCCVYRLVLGDVERGTETHTGARG